MQILKKYKYYILAIIFVIILFLIFVFSSRNAAAPLLLEAGLPKANIQAPAQTEEAKSPEISFVGPRGNLPANAPSDYGLWSFAIPVPGVLSRSGQPTLSGFQWMKNNGWKSDIDLRVDGDHAPEVSDDSKIPGFNALGFNYLKIQMLDGAAPTDQQAEQFLSFVTNPANQPAHVHCRGGIGRAGVMVALYRYAVQGWPLDQAIEESKLFQGGISEGQKNWIEKWAKSHFTGNWKSE